MTRCAEFHFYVIMALKVPVVKSKNVDCSGLPLYDFSKFVSKEEIGKRAVFTYKLNAGHIQSFVRPLTVSSHFCSFSMCKHRFPVCTLQTNRDLSRYEFLLVSSTRRKERIHKRRGAVPPKNKFITLAV